MEVYHGIAYEIAKSDSQWHWTIQETKSMRLAKRKTPVSYATHREAEKACRTEIDRDANTERI
ncbi:MAG: hypothetical protein ABL866_04335 [Devosia sp.]